jgi:uncharacterized protein YwqG
MTKENFIKKLQEQGLSVHFEAFEPHLRPSIGLELTQKSENNLSIGSSKIGGRPDLPKHLQWARENPPKEPKMPFSFLMEAEKVAEKPLGFVAQINLAEVAACDETALLPKTGILYFFYEMFSDNNWANFEEKWKVMYYNGDLSKLKRVNFPEDLNEYSQYESCGVFAKKQISFPYEDVLRVHLLVEEWEKYGDILYAEALSESNKMLGNSDNIQNTMELEAEMCRLGINYSDFELFTDDKKQNIQVEAAKWKLLLQIDSNDECNMMWGDMGRIYFWIKEEDLQARRFEKCWVSMQCG